MRGRCNHPTWSLVFWIALALAPLALAAEGDGDSTEQVTSVFAVSGMT